MKIHFLETIDCTSDAHYVEFDKETRDQIADVILEVCKSDLVQNIESVTLEIGDETFASDSFTTSDYSSKAKKQTGRFAKKHKTEGLYFDHDAADEDGFGKPVDAKHHLPPGLTGLRQVTKLLEALPEDARFHLNVRVVWKFAGDSSCSDYIQWPDEEGTGSMATVNFSNQDSWIGKEGYKEHCEALTKLVGHTIEAREDD